MHAGDFCTLHKLASVLVPRVDFFFPTILQLVPSHLPAQFKVLEPNLEALKKVPL